MKWMLVVLVGGVTPVQTDVLFEKLSDCLAAEEQLGKTHLILSNNSSASRARNPALGDGRGSCRSRVDQETWIMRQQLDLRAN